MVKISGTSVTLGFILKPAGGYAPVYYGRGEGSLALASVNAGNSQDLYVGGGGINGGFAKLLSRTQKTGGYQARHQALVDDAAKTGEAFMRYDDDDPTEFSYVYASKISDVAGWYEGICFVDVFSTSHRPAGNPHNSAMLYAAPPHGHNHPKEADFLDAVGQTGRNIATTVARYNAIAPQQNVPGIEALRLCLYSSGIYNQYKVSLDKIALAIFDGVSAGLAAESSGLKELQMPYSDDPDDPLFSAVKAKYGD
jgi:hypothetical protein